MRAVNEDRLKKTYEYIRKFQNENGRSPSFREILDDCQYVGLSSVQADINRLKERGLLLRDNKKVSLPNNAQTGTFHGANILGTVRCGQPSPTIEDIESTVVLPDEIFGKGDQFILHAEGESMIKKGIFDGDLLVVEKRPVASIGETVVALLGDEATTKVLAKKEGKYYLMAANEDHEQYDVYPEGEFTILGVVKYVIHAVPEKDCC